MTDCSFVTMEVEEEVLESPASPDEIIFIEDRRPGNVSPVLENSKSNKSINEKHETFTEDFIKLSSDVEDYQFNTNVKSDEINLRFHTDTVDTAGPEIKKNIELEDGLCYVIEDRNPHLTGEDTQSPKYKINVSFFNTVALFSFL